MGMPSHLSLQVVAIDNHAKQPRQNLVPVTSEALDENELEYKGPPIHVQNPYVVAQSTAQYPYQDFQSGMPLTHPGEPFVVVPPFAYPGAS